MNTDKIDFTKSHVCALCGRGSHVSLSDVIIKKHGNYTNCKTLMCTECVKLVNAKKNGNTLYVSDISHAKRDLQKMTVAMQKSFDSICADHSDLLIKTLGSNVGIQHWVDFASPMKIELVPHFEFHLDGWIKAKNDAYASRVKIVELFNKMDFRCPVCNAKLTINVKDPSKIEINDVFEFSCKNRCFHFNESDLAEHFSKAYDSWRFAPVRSWSNTYGLTENERAKRIETSITEFALGQLQQIFTKMTNEFWSLRERYYRDVLKVCDKHTDANGIMRCGGCSSCYAALDKTNKSKLNEFRQKIAEANGWSKGSDLTLDQMFNAQSNAILKPSEHCKVFCKMSPDGGALNVCGITGYECSYHASGKTCKKCSSCISGKPIGNFLALHKMCVHYKDGKCDLGANAHIQSHKDGTCSYANDFIFKNRGFPCESFKFDTTIDLTKALEESKLGKRYY